MVKTFSDFCPGSVAGGFSGFFVRLRHNFLALDAKAHPAIFRACASEALVAKALSDKVNFFNQSSRGQPSFALGRL